MAIYKEQIAELQAMKKPPETLFYKGNAHLLKQKKISIVGTRKPNQYTKQMTFELASKLSAAGVCIVSGAAMGVDALAHKGAGSAHTIAVMANGLDVIYPQVNRSLIQEIETEGLTLSQFEPEFKATRWSFVVRNEIVVALGDVLVVTQADSNSGTMRSVAYAKKMGKSIYVLPHRLGESMGTQQLLECGDAEAIYDIDAFVQRYADKRRDKLDDLLAYCQAKPSYNDAINRFGERLFEYELEGKIQVNDGVVSVT